MSDRVVDVYYVTAIPFVVRSPASLSPEEYVERTHERERRDYGKFFSAEDAERHRASLPRQYHASRVECRVERVGAQVPEHRQCAEYLSRPRA